MSDVAFICKGRLSATGCTTRTSTSASSHREPGGNIGCRCLYHAVCLTWRIGLEEIIQASSWEMQEADEESPLQPETFVAEKLPEVVLQLQDAMSNTVAM